MNKKLRHIFIKAVLLAVSAVVVAGCAPDGSSAEKSDSGKSVDSIEILTAAAKTVFSTGDSFSADGISVRANYEDGSTETLSASDCTFKINGSKYQNGSTKLSNSGIFTVYVIYKDKSATYTITVNLADGSSYTAPTFVDNYVNIASFANRSKWNLSNVHDPTVFKWTDGYYYMFGTSASYGNAHLDASTGKYFQGKRSKDLVNWDYVPGIFDDGPDWVVTKLNEIRAKLRQAKIDAGETVDDDELQPIAKSDISFGFWAPSARTITVDGVTKVRMYYSIVVDNSIGNGKTATDTANFDNTWGERAFIGVAETTNPNGGPSAWTDLGFVTCSSSDKGTDYSRTTLSNWDAYFYFNAIDPGYFIDDDDTHWLVYGSWHSGFALCRINPTTGKIAAVSGSDYLYGDVTGDFEMGNPWSSDADGLKQNGYGIRIFARYASNSRWQPSEGPEIVRYNDYYWLFFANDDLDVPYQTRVVRAEKIEGPYYAIQGSEMTNNVDGHTNSSENIYPIVTHPYKFSDEEPTNGYGSCYGWVGISHCAIFQDDDDNWYYMSQQRLPENVAGNASSNAIMMGGVRKIVWTPKTSGSTDLWPMVLPERYGAVPESTITSDELLGTWQHIELTYNKGTMDEAEELVLESDGSMSGAMEGTWSFDESAQQITFTPSSGTAFVVSVAREVDWEAYPRKATIVYTGCTSGSPYSTYWGKQSKLYPVTFFEGTDTVDLGTSPNFYLIQQIGSISVTDSKGTDSAKEYSTSATTWWSGQVSTSSLSLADGGSITWTVKVTSENSGLALEGTNGTNYLNLNLNYSASADAWGTGSSWSVSSSNGSQYGKQNHTYKITVSRSGNVYTVSAEDEGIL